MGGCEIRSPQAGAVVHKNTPGGFLLWLWKVLQGWFLLDPHEGRRDTPPPPPTHTQTLFPVGLQIVGMEGLVPGCVWREDLLMVLLSSYSCSWINHQKLTIISVSTNYKKVWGPAPLGTLVNLDLIRHLLESQQSLHIYFNVINLQGLLN